MEVKNLGKYSLLAQNELIYMPASSGGEGWPHHTLTMPKHSVHQNDRRKACHHLNIWRASYFMQHMPLNTCQKLLGAKKRSTRLMVQTDDGEVKNGSWRTSSTKWNQNPAPGRSHTPSVPQSNQLTPILNCTLLPKKSCRKTHRTAQHIGNLNVFLEEAEDD